MKYLKFKDLDPRHLVMPFDVEYVRLEGRKDIDPVIREPDYILVCLDYIYEDLKEMLVSKLSCCNAFTECAACIIQYIEKSLSMQILASKDEKVSISDDLKAEILPKIKARL